MSGPKFFGKRERIAADFFEGEIDKYNWVDVGSSYLPSDLLAAFLRAQLEHRDQIQSMRRQIWENYSREPLPGPKPAAPGSRLSHLNATIVITCFI